MAGDTPVFVYMTAGTGEEAARIGRTLVEEGLAACINILSPICSIYRWQGKVEEGEEVAFIAKTRADRFQDLCARVRVLHSYETPCIVELPLGRGDAPYLEWLVRESAPGSGIPR